MRDVVWEHANEGSDRIVSSVSYSLPSDVEALIFIGSRAANGTGNELANSLYGNVSANKLHGGAGDDTLSGRDGNDTLYGDSGNDTLVGGAGDDKFYGSAGADRLHGGSGADTFLFQSPEQSNMFARD